MSRIILFLFVPPGTMVEYWDDVPAPSQYLVQAREVIYTHVERLIEELSQGAQQEEEAPR